MQASQDGEKNDVYIHGVIKKKNLKFKFFFCTRIQSTSLKICEKNERYLTHLTLKSDNKYFGKKIETAQQKPHSIGDQEQPQNCYSF